MQLIRPFVETDLIALKALVDNTIDVSYAGIYPPAAIAFFKEYHRNECILSDAQVGHTLVIEDSGNLLATGTLLGTNIRRMFVAPEMQGQGLGSALIKSIEEYACSIGLKTLDLSASFPARDFYIHCGYHIVSEEVTLFPNNEELRYYEMIKTLTRGN